MTLGQRQRIFTRMVGMLIEYAYATGYELTFGDAYRDPRVHGSWGEKMSYSASKSTHKVKTAVDFNLFKNGRYLKKTSDHAPLGKYWLQLGDHFGVNAAWGGSDGNNDGNHYSIRHQGKW